MEEQLTEEQVTIMQKIKRIGGIQDISELSPKEWAKIFTPDTSKKVDISRPFDATVYQPLFDQLKIEAGHSDTFNWEEQYPEKKE